MTKKSRLVVSAASITLTAALMAIGTSPSNAQAANPCAPKASTAAPGKPEIDPKLVLRPKGTKLGRGDLKKGAALFKSEKLGTSGLSCQSCHANNDNFNASFAKPYPHPVEMASDKAEIKSIQLDEMIQLCMVVPMQAKPLRWDSPDLAALAAYTGELQKAYKKKPPATSAKGANPCAPKAGNPCAPKAGNPCAPKAANPCAPKKK